MMTTFELDSPRKILHLQRGSHGGTGWIFQRRKRIIFKNIEQGFQYPSNQQKSSVTLNESNLEMIPQYHV
jgi:hypothetical protein